KKCSRTQSRTNLFGASSRNTPSSSMACRGRIQVLNCCCESSPSRRSRHIFHIDISTAAPPLKPTSHQLEPWESIPVAETYPHLINLDLTAAILTARRP